MKRHSRWSRKRRRTRDWDEWYADARAYREERGDLLVPRDYITANGFRLGRWIGNQRAKYNQVPSAQGSLSKTQIALLEQIGMVWRLEYRFPWDAWIEQVKCYYNAHGDLLVPPDYNAGNFRLGNWISEQRKRYAAGEMTEKQIADLDAYGMVWSFGIVRREWGEWYADAKAYYEHFGNLLIKCDYETEQGYKLGYWVFEQRVLYSGKKGVRLKKEQIRLLEEIGMVWDLDDVRNDAWEQMYIWVAAYLAEHGTLPLWPRAITAPDGRKMDAWITTQRTYLAEGRLSAEQAERLAALGIMAQNRTGKYDEFYEQGLDDIQAIWAMQWEQMYVWVSEYREKYGQLPKRGADEIAPDGRSMEHWVCKQRKALADGRLSEDRRQKLFAIGIMSVGEEQERDWMEMYRCVAAYKAEYGKLPAQKCPETAPDGRKLGLWISVQKRRLAEGRTSGEQEKLLAALGVRTQGQQWQEMYRYVAAYRAQHGRLPVQTCEERAPDGHKLSAWVTVQKRNLAKGMLTAQQEAQLKALGLEAVKQQK